MTDVKDLTVIVANASMFEPLTGGKGKFTTAVALFNNSEPVSEVMKWAHDHAVKSGKELIKVEVSYNQRCH